MKREKEVEFRVKLALSLANIQIISDLIDLKRLIIVCFPKQKNAGDQIQSSYRSTNHAF